MFKFNVDEQMALDHRTEAMQAAELDRSLAEIEGPRRKPRPHRLLVAAMVVIAGLVALTQVVEATTRSGWPRAVLW